ncbi:hypothetical protein [Candidatus Nitrosotenuis uzonensis]|uniref:Uncharacterized protein n=1 Tax=Candidatus Nitrosotenuis uzonensis TaxID=1407055 RepID=A0A812F1K6_9ARCH|nr:hypothetical protein [Candidatus Nitrosotenuis uzonensis]CAE6488056.1 hypothetical protein NUZ5A_20405 [Candidatus Nitrosotenuis uzonensis]
MGKTVPVIFALLAAGLVTSGVGIWKVAEPVNTIYNATSPILFQKPAEKNIIDESDGNSLVGLGIFFGILAIVAIFLGRPSRRY